MSIKERLSRLKWLISEIRASRISINGKKRQFFRGLMEAERLIEEAEADPDSTTTTEFIHDGKVVWSRKKEAGR